MANGSNADDAGYAYLSQYDPFSGFESGGNVYEIGDAYEIGLATTGQYYVGASPFGLASGDFGAGIQRSMPVMQLAAAPQNALLGSQIAYQPQPLPAMSGTLPAPPPLFRPPMVVKQKAPDQARLFPLGMNSGSTIAAGVSSLPGDVQVQPQEIVKPRRWSISPSIAPDFLINSLVVGVKPQTPGNSAMSAEAFLPNCQFSDVDFDTCQISQQIAAIVTNINAAAARQFLSTFYCYVAR